MRWKKSGGSDAAVQRMTQSLCVVFVSFFLLYRRRIGGKLNAIQKTERQKDKRQGGKENESDKQRQRKKIKLMEEEEMEKREGAGLRHMLEQSF